MEYLGARVDASVDVKLQLVAVLQLEAEAGALLLQAAPVQDGIAVFVFLSLFLTLTSYLCLLSLSTCAGWQSGRTRSLPRPCSASTPGSCGPACAAAPGPKCTLVGKHLTIPKEDRSYRHLLAAGSTPLVGSSRTTTRLFPENARATDKRRRNPYLTGSSTTRGL